MYLRAQKELCELPLHGCVRIGTFMRPAVFVNPLQVIWTLFFAKNMNFRICLGHHFWPGAREQLDFTL